MPDEPQVQETILIVDRDVLVRTSLAQYLRDCGYAVVEAANAEEAVALLRRDTAVDVVLSDVAMPGALDGFGLAKWIRTHRPQTKIILAGTVLRSIDAAHDLCDEGPLPVPYHAQTVHDRIRRLLAARSATAAGPATDRSRVQSQDAQPEP